MNTRTLSNYNYAVAENGIKNKISIIFMYVVHAWLHLECSKVINASASFTIGKMQKYWSILQSSKQYSTSLENVLPIYHYDHELLEKIYFFKRNLTILILLSTNWPEI